MWTHLLFVLNLVWIDAFSTTTVPKLTKGCVSDPADVVFLLDSSGSVGPINFQKSLEFIAEFAKHYAIGPLNVQVGIVVFSGFTSKEFDLKDFHNIDELEQNVMNITYRHNGTHTSTALQFVRENSFTDAAGNRPHVPNFLIVITDGVAQPATFNPAVEAAKLHQTDIEVFAIGIGTMSMDELNVIGTDKNHVLTVTDHLNLHLPLREIRCEQFKNRTTTPIPLTTATTTVKTTTIQSTTKTTTIQPTTKTTAIPTTSTQTIAQPSTTSIPTSTVKSNTTKGCVSDPADVVFLLDRSGSVRLHNFQKSLEFISEFAKHYVIGPRNVQVGIVSFAGFPLKEFDLKDFHNIDELEQNIMNISYVNTSGTHTSTALQFVRENSFTDAAGNRPHVSNFLIVITDGMSTPEKFDPTAEAAILHKTDIEVFAIGIGDNISIAELNVIATDKNHVLTVDDHLNLHLPLREIRCEQFKTNTLPTSTVPSTSTKGFVECMGCKRIPEPHDCTETILCAEHEQCFTDFYITPEGNAFYDLGCAANRVCDAISQYGKRKADYKRQDESVHMCQECCKTNNCNRFGCSDKAKLNRTACYSCQDVAQPSDCDVINICDIDKTCFARHFINDMFEERWTLGCEEKRTCLDIAKYSSYIGHPKTKRQIGGFASLDLCYYCCDDNFCNKRDCIKGLQSIAINGSQATSSLPIPTLTTQPTVLSTPHA